MLSDTENNFAAADKELHQGVRDLAKKEAMASLSSNGTQMTWHFSPQRARNHRRIFEIMVRCIKKTFQETLALANLKAKELLTGVLQTEWVLSLPTTSSDYDD